MGENSRWLWKSKSCWHSFCQRWCSHSWPSEVADFFIYLFFACVCVHTLYQAETHTVSWHFGGFWSHSPSIVSRHDSHSLAPSSSSKPQHTMIAILSVRGLWSHLTLRTWSVFLILTKINLLLSRWMLCACNRFDSHIQQDSGRGRGFKKGSASGSSDVCFLNWGKGNRIDSSTII